MGFPIYPFPPKVCSKRQLRRNRKSRRRSNSAIDGVLEVVDGSENAAFEAAIGELGKEAFGGVEQGRRGGREVEGPAWMLGEPLANLWILGSGIVIDDRMDRLEQIDPQMPARDSRRGNSLAHHFFIFKAAPSKVVTMACISPSLVM
jgi:hypothetical protein